MATFEHVHLIEMSSNRQYSIRRDIDAKFRGFGVNGGPAGILLVLRGGRCHIFSGRRRAVTGADGGQTWPVAQIVHYHR